MNEGTVATRIGLQGIPSIAEEMMIERDLRLLEYVSASIQDDKSRPHYHVAHISTAGSAELIRQAKKKKLPVTCEVTPHHFTLTDEAVQSFDTNTKMSPPLRTKDDVQALRECLRDGTIEVIATDHAPHSYDEKQVEFVYAPFGIVGLETAIGLAVSELVEPKILSLSQLVEKFSLNPRKILNLPAASVAEGQKANLTLFNPQQEWVVDVTSFKSKSKNSPFHGRRLKGKAIAIINHGSLYFV